MTSSEIISNNETASGRLGRRRDNHTGGCIERIRSPRPRKTITKPAEILPSFLLCFYFFFVRTFEIDVCERRRETVARTLMIIIYRVCIITLSLLLQIFFFIRRDDDDTTTAALDRRNTGSRSLDSGRSVGIFIFFFFSANFFIFIRIFFYFQIFFVKNESGGERRGRVHICTYIYSRPAGPNDHHSTV